MMVLVILLKLAALSEGLGESSIAFSDIDGDGDQDVLITFMIMRDLLQNQ
jgi:hypothetical protein